ncbi:MAG TPA: hypothetical protein GX734_00805 [Clostridiaceae bacterium]|nr:hypothetical protein [Clostridiaceae bacterium]
MKPNVAILGGGNGACAYAADLKLKGSKVSLYEDPRFFSNLEEAVKIGGLYLENRCGLPNVSEGFANLDLITDNIEEAIADAELIFVVVPAFGQEAFMKAAAPYLKDGQLICFSPANFGASIRMSQILEEVGNNSDVLLVDTECMMYSGFKDDPTHVWVSGYKIGMKAAALPATRNKEAIEKIHNVYPEWEDWGNVIEIGLRNINTVFHAPICVCNASLIERAEEFLFYREGGSPSVGRVVEAVESERIAVCNALGLRSEPSLDVLLKWYAASGCKGDTLAEAMSQNPVYEWDYGPTSLHHRFLTEDIPYGMIPLEQLGEVAGVKTPVTTAVIELGIVLTNMDLRSQARDLKAIGLDQLSKDELVTYVEKG